jgi:hypothetical protein
MMYCVECSSCLRCAFWSDAYFMDGIFVTYSLVASVFIYRYTYVYMNIYVKR